jgi:hypothetical protein
MRDVILAYEQQHHYENRLKSFSDQYADVERRLTISEQVFRGLSLLVTDLGRIGILAAALVASLATSRSGITTVGTSTSWPRSTSACSYPYPAS